MSDIVHFSDLAGSSSGTRRKSSASGTVLQQAVVQAARIRSESNANKLTGIDNGIFSISKVQFDFSGSLANMAVNNNILIMAMTHSRLLRIDLLRPQVVEDVDIPRKTEDSIEALFLDPTGRHCLIGMKSGDVFYHYYTWKKAKPLSKLKNIGICCVGWSSTAVDVTRAGSSGSVLVGTKLGSIYELELEPSDEYFKREERYLKEVFRIDPSVCEFPSVTGIHIGRIPELSADLTSKTRIFILFTIDNRIYQLKGTVSPDPRVAEPMLEPVFISSQPNYQELPGHFDKGQLSVFYAQGIAKSSFAWATAPGIYSGEFKLAVASDNDSIIDGSQVLPYPADFVSPGMSEIAVEAPVNIACTQFHHILLYSDRIRILSKMNDEIVYDSLLPQDLAKGCRLTVDDVKGTYWLFSEKCIYEIVITDEDKDIWSIYLEKKQFDSALEHAKTEDQKDLIKRKQADTYYSQERYLLAASLYGQTGASFEQCVLKFMGLKGRQHDQHALTEALEKYLVEKFKRLPATQMTQKTLIATMILDIMLSQYKQANETRVNFEYVKNWLQLNEVADSLDKRSSYQLFVNHGAIELLVEYASIIRDYERVINYYIDKKDWNGALRTLARNHSFDLIYKYFPLVMRHSPKETIDLIIRFERLDMKELIRGILGTDTEAKSGKLIKEQAIRLLEHHIYKLNNTDVAIHNFLVSLYVAQDDEESTKALLSFMRSPSRFFDLQYALRLCNQWKRYDACIVLYGELGLYEDAVDLALKLKDETLAEIYANKAYDNESLRKKLWLKISRHKISSSGDMKTVLKNLKDTETVKIQDVLSYLPDSVVIDDIRDEISETLQDYKRQIEQIKAEMYDAARSAEAMRKEIENLDNRYVEISCDYKCPLCSLQVMTSNFFAFSCGHHFHSSCLANHVTDNYLTVPIQHRVRAIETEMRRLELVDREDKLSGQDYDKLEKELHNLIATDCVVCGVIVVKTIDRPLISKTDIELQRQWAI